MKPKNCNEMIDEIIPRIDSGEIIYLAIQYMTADRKMWVKTIDGDFEIPNDMMDNAAEDYARISKKGN